MIAISTVCYVAAFICFLLAAFGTTVGRINLVAVGLALWLLADHLLSVLRLG